MKSYDVIVIGAGHNGMVAAARLAKSGRSVLVLEASARHGGLAASGEFAPGFTGCALAHRVDGLSADLVRGLELEKHGFNTKGAAPNVTSIAADRDALTLSGMYDPAGPELGAMEREGLGELRARLLFQSSLLQRFLQFIPPQEDSFPLSAKSAIAKAAFDLKRAGKTELQEFLRMALMCVADIADEHLNDDRIKGLLAFDGTLGVHLGPRSPTSILGLYLKMAHMQTAMSGSQICSANHTTQLIDAIHASAINAGAEFQFGAGVREIVVENGAAIGVVASDNRLHKAGSVLSAVHPKTTFLNLVGARHLDTGFARDIASIRSKGNVSKLNLVLDREPDFSGIKSLIGMGRMVHAPSIDHIERNFNPSKYGELPENPCYEFGAERGDKDTVYLSILIQNTPFELKQGWEKGGAKLQKSVLESLEQMAPGIAKAVIASRLFSPADVADQFHVPGGHWHHGELQIDRLFSLRPVFGAGNYRTPIDGLYICGAGTHPGGGINGISGMNASKVMVADMAGGER
jgi:phytoene dehydrogenase-like protein